MSKKYSKGFTLIELLVVVAIIGVLASVIMTSMSQASSKGRDAKRKSDLEQLRNAIELRYTTLGSYPSSAGWFSNPGHGGLDVALTPTYISKVPDSPKPPAYMYWRKDYRGYGCLTSGTANEYGFYAQLENPSSTELATISDSFDLCVKNSWGMNYKISN